MTKKCAGCGVTLQFINELELGFIPEKKYEDSSYCMRCFKMTHYGISNKDDAPFKNEELINKINKANIHTIFLIDFLNINEEVINIFKSIKTEKTLIINKCEMLPKFINRKKLLETLRQLFEINNIILKGKLGSKDYEIVYDYLKKNDIKECIFVGLSNVGKSTLINDLIKHTKSDNNKLTVNKIENTTLDFIELNLLDFKIIDTPGFIINNYLDIPKSKKIKSYIFQMKKDEVLNLTNDYYLKTENNSNINYFTNFLYEKNIKKNFKNNSEFITELSIPENSDLLINGIGFITFNKSTKIKINIDKKYLSIRKSLFRR